MPVDRGMDKEDMVLIYTMEYCSVIKKNEILPFAAIWLGVKCHIEWSKSDREEEISYDISYTWNLKRNDTNELTKQRLTDLENELMAARRKG